MPPSYPHTPMPHPSHPHAYDVLVIGGGAAGLYAALCLPQHLQIGLITKDELSLSASDWAQGGIAAAIAADDSPILHIEDTLKAGAGLCDRQAVELLAEAAPRCIQSLVQMGVAFDRQGEALALTLEAAHSRRRVLHAADTTGRAMITRLTAQVLDRPNIQVLSPAFVLDLWLTSPTPTSPPQCQGLCLVYDGQIRWLRAGAMILATGGGGQVFAQTTNPAVSTGDGVAMAWRAGAEVRDLEFVQFHPTALTKPGAPRFLISEAVRGEGAHLVDDTGHRFVFDYHPAGELAPRDVVSRAIYNHLQQTASDPATAHVWLDLQSIPVATIRHRFPNIIQVCQKWGIDIFQERIPVAPAAHYWMGGVTTDLLSCTTIPGLYAVGETASTGVHGANRLASNSLLECLVFGAQLAQMPVERGGAQQGGSAAGQAGQSHVLIPDSRFPVRMSLQRLLWQSAGICREAETLQAAIEQVEQWREEFSALPLTRSILELLETNTACTFAPVPPTPTQDTQQLDTQDQRERIARDATEILRDWGETRNLLDVGWLILKSALYRTESRGGHYRADYPQTDLAWQAHTIVRPFSQSCVWQTSNPII